jgi:hypothetical protein
MYFMWVLQLTWTFEGKPFTEFPTDMFGFIYLITYSDGTKYLGKKQAFSFKELPVLKNGKVRPDSIYRVGKNKNGKRVQYDVIRKEMPWKRYVGSSKLTGGKTIASKEIIALCPTKRNLTYMEVKAMFYYEAIEDPLFLNENILGRFFRDRTI